MSLLSQIDSIIDHYEDPTKPFDEQSDTYKDFVQIVRLFSRYHATILAAASRKILEKAMPRSIHSA